MEFRGDISGTYSDGVVRPDARLDLPDGSRVTISPADPPTAESRRQGWEVIDRIRREGLIRLTGPRWTRDDLYDRR